jgi:hypothetical protein
MKTYNLQLVGTSPLLLHRISKHQLRDQIAFKANGGEPEEEALEAMSKDEGGNPAVPVDWLWDAIRVGCSRITVNGQQVSFSQVSRAISLKPKTLPLKGSDSSLPKWRVYTSVQHAKPGSKETILVVAPEFRGWSLEVEITAYLEFPDKALLLRILSEAGRAGIGLFHPPKKHFGQFRVERTYNALSSFKV